MAKRKTKKSQRDFLVSIVLAVLAVLVICTLFMPVFSSKGDLGGVLQTKEAKTTGADVLTACFHEKTSGDYTGGANTLITLKTSDDYGFVTSVFVWTYFLSILAAAVVLASAVLSMLGIRINLLGLVGGAALLLLALVAFIFSLIVAGKFGYAGTLVSYTTTLAVGGWFLLAGVLCGAGAAYTAKK